jgi:hypothetical protein
LAAGDARLHPNLTHGTVSCVASWLRMQKTLFIIVALATGSLASTVQADMPRNVKCAIMAQQAAREMGRDYQKTYNRKFELCMLRSMPREQQTSYLIEKLKPYVAISPGFRPEPATETEPVIEVEDVPRQREKKFTGTWVRISPNVWVLNP